MNLILKFIKIYYGFINVLIGLATLIVIVLALIFDLRGITPLAMNIVYTSKLCFGFFIIGLIAIYVVTNFELITTSLKRHISRH